MNNLQLAIIKNKNFYNLVNELDFDCAFFDENNFFLKVKSNSKLTVRIIFPENLTLKNNNKFFTENVPTLFLLKDKNFLVNNNLKPLSFHVVLDIPIDLFFFKEIISILKMKYIFFEKSKILISNYELDSNQRILSKNNKTIKLTEKELSLILVLKKKNKHYSLRVYCLFHYLFLYQRSLKCLKDLKLRLLELQEMLELLWFNGVHKKNWLI
jgi:hypothetical protein